MNPSREARIEKLLERIAISLEKMANPLVEADPLPKFDADADIEYRREIDERA
jgi:hypothetical protein